MTCMQSEETVRQWADDISVAARSEGHRPHSLLVFLNPFGGSQKARAIWAAQVLPIFRLAGLASLWHALLACNNAHAASASTLGGVHQDCHHCA